MRSIFGVPLDRHVGHGVKKVWPKFEIERLDEILHTLYLVGHCSFRMALECGSYS